MLVHEIFLLGTYFSSPKALPGMAPKTKQTKEVEDRQERVKTVALHTANSTLSLGITNEPLSQPVVIPKHCQLCSKKLKNKNIFKKIETKLALDRNTSSFMLWENERDSVQKVRVKDVDN